MNLVSYTRQGRSSFGVIRGDRIVDLAAATGASTLRDAIAAGNLLDVAKSARDSDADVKLADVTLLTPIPFPDKIICIGLNYRDHAKEAGHKLPENPMLFGRFANSLSAHNAPIVCPRLSSDFDYEGELAIIIGKGGRDIPASHAMRHIFGYSCFNDGSVRDFQQKHSITAGKNFTASGAFGPWIATADTIPDPARLTLTTRVNGAQVQHKGIDNMIFDIPAIVAYVSKWTELAPGDVIATGTPEGVGFARKPPLWLKPGDTIEVEISDVGLLRNQIIAQ